MTARDAANLAATAAVGYKTAERTHARTLTRWERWLLKQAFKSRTVVQLLSDRGASIAMRKLANIIDTRLDFQEEEELTPVHTIPWATLEP